MPVLAVAVAVAAIAVFAFLSPKRQTAAQTLESRIRALGLDASRLDADEARTILEVRQAVVDAHGDADLLAADPRFANALAVLEANYSTAEIYEAARRMGIVVTQ